MAARDVRPHGIVLAGGLSRRMGRDKADVMLRGQTLLSWTSGRLASQCASVAVSRHGLSADDRLLGRYPIIPDSVEHRVGPLAGVIAALDWVAERDPSATHIVTVAVDTPFLPPDLVSRLDAARRESGRAIACAVSGERVHPSAALWPLDVRDALREAVFIDGVRRVMSVLELFGFATAIWPTAPYDPFLNVNSSADLARAEEVAGLIEQGRESLPQ